MTGPHRSLARWLTGAGAATSLIALPALGLEAAVRHDAALAARGNPAVSDALDTAARPELYPTVVALGCVVGPAGVLLGGLLRRRGVR